MEEEPWQQSARSLSANKFLWDKRMDSLFKLLAKGGAETRLLLERVQ